MFRSIRSFWSLGVLAGVAVLTGGCFNRFEEYRQIAMPSRPPGAASIPASATPAEVFPLQTGARYEYGARFGLGGGQFTGRAIVSVVDAWKVGEREEQAVKVVATYFNQTRIDPYVFVRTNERIGLYEKYPPDKITFFLPTMLKNGQFWSVETGEGVGRAVVEAVEPITVPAGAFKESYRVRYENPGAATDVVFWFVPHLGMVRADVAMTVSLLPLRGTLELESHHSAL